MANKDMYASFFIRLSKRVDGPSGTRDGNMVFEIEHIQSGEVRVLGTQEAFFEFFRSFTEQLSASNGSD